MKKYLVFLTINNLLLTSVGSLINPLTHESSQRISKLTPLPSIIDQQVFEKEIKRFNIFKQSTYKANFKNWSAEQIAYLESFENKAAGDITDINWDAVQQYQNLKMQKHFQSLTDIDKAFSAVRFKSNDGQYINTSDINLTKIVAKLHENNFNVAKNVDEEMLNLFNFLWAINPQSSLELFQHFVVINNNFITPFDEWKAHEKGQVLGLVTFDTLNNGVIKAPSVILTLSKYGMDQRYMELTYNAGIEAGKGGLSIFTHEIGHAFDIYYEINKLKQTANWNALSIDNPVNYTGLSDAALMQNWYKEVIVGQDITKNPPLNSVNLLNSNLKQKHSNQFEMSAIAEDLINFVVKKLNLPTNDPVYIKTLLGSLIRSSYALDGDSMHELTAEAFSRWVNYWDGNTTLAPSWAWSVLNEFFISEFAKINK